MSFHRTASGSITLRDQWGHGKAARCDWYSTPATIVVDDGDGHYTAWSYTGRMRDAAETAARFDLRNDGRYVAVLEGTSVNMQQPPADFWIVQPDGSVEPNTAAHPEVLAY